MRQQWLQSIGRPISLSTNTRICSRHFEGGVKYPIPTVFSWCKKKRAPRPLPSPKLEEQLYKGAQKELDARDVRIEELEAEVVGLRVEVFGIQRFSSSDSDVSFYTAYFIEPLLGQLNYRPESESYNIRGRHRSLPPIDEFFMVLVRLCLGLLEGDLAHRFNLSISSVSRILTTWIILLDQQLRPLITFPSCTVVQRHMPSQFRLKYPDTRVIIDCTEIFTDTPSSLPVQAAVYSY